MKTSILALFTVLSLSANVFAAEKPAAISEVQKQALVKAVFEEPMIHAAVKWNHRLAAKCTHEVLKTRGYEGGVFDFEMRIDCHLPDGPDFGGGSTAYFIKGYYTDKTAILDSINIERAG